MVKIGIFDSGIGGLWILKHLREALPLYNYVFVGDQGHVPYGNKSNSEIREFSEKITEFLIKKGSKIIVIACNTASAAALKYLREKFPEVVFVGMEPAVKPASEMTHTKKIGILATPGTFGGELFSSSVDKYANGIEIFKNTCDGLVSEIEKGDWKSREIKKILEKAIYPMLEEETDVIVLGCTHYPLVIPTIEEIVKYKAKIIDPTPSIVSRVKKIVSNENSSITKNETGHLEIYTSGDPNKMERIVNSFWDEKIKTKKIDL